VLRRDRRCSSLLVVAGLLQIAPRRVRGRARRSSPTSPPGSACWIGRAGVHEHRREHGRAADQGPDAAADRATAAAA
jgi:hypothetical protein